MFMLLINSMSAMLTARLVVRPLSGQKSCRLTPRIMIFLPFKKKPTLLVNVTVRNPMVSVRE
jgi:hypothetical protein